MKESRSGECNTSILQLKFIRKNVVRLIFYFIFFLQIYKKKVNK